MAYPLWYVEEEQRRSWPPAAATNSLPLGWADLASPRRVVPLSPSRRRRHAGREGVRPRRLRTGLQYAALLAPCAARSLAQRRAREILGHTLSAHPNISRGLCCERQAARSKEERRQSWPPAAAQPIVIRRVAGPSCGAPRGVVRRLRTALQYAALLARLARGLHLGPAQATGGVGMGPKGLE